MRSKNSCRAITFLPLLLLAPVLHAQTNDATSTNPGTSKVRIVRLSQVRGSVQIDRSEGRGYERGIANLPVVEHNQLRTGEGIAEVEFEDNSSLRLAPNSLVEFPRLERSGSGATISSIHLIEGTAYISLVKPQSGKAPVNEFTLIFGDRTLNLAPATHVRLTLEGAEAQLAVLDGSVHVDEANGALIIPKKKTAIFQALDQSEPTVARSVEANAFDEWDHEAASYHSGVASSQRVQLALCLWSSGHVVLRELYQRGRLRWIHVAALLRQRCVGSICEWHLGVVPGRGLFMGFSVSLGVDAVSLRFLGILRQRGLGMDARRRRRLVRRE